MQRPSRGPCPSMLKVIRPAHVVLLTLSMSIKPGGIMARKTVVVSDLSGEAIEEGKAAKVRITFDDGRRGSIEMDVTADEAAEMGRKGRQVARRGRKPKTS